MPKGAGGCCGIDADAHDADRGRTLEIRPAPGYLRPLRRPPGPRSPGRARPQGGRGAPAPLARGTEAARGRVAARRGGRDVIPFVCSVNFCLVLQRANKSMVSL